MSKRFAVTLLAGLCIPMQRPRVCVRKGGRRIVHMTELVQGLGIAKDLDGLFDQGELLSLVTLLLRHCRLR